jgi:hypothetical protein
MHNIDYQEFGENTVIPLHGGSYFVRRPLTEDPRTFNGDRDAAWSPEQRMLLSERLSEKYNRQAYAESLQYEPHRLTFGERLVLLFRFHAFAIGVALYLLAVSVACYFIFQLARGVL